MANEVEIRPYHYQTLAASSAAVFVTAADASKGTSAGNGAKNDILDRLILIPASTSPGAVTIADGSASAVTVFAGGASSLTELRPIYVEFGEGGIRSRNGAWTVTNGASVSAIIIGRPT